MKLTNFKKSVIVIALSGFALSAYAADTDAIGESQSPNHQTFKMFDTNNDGVLTAAELSKDSSFTKERIAHADKDNDGTLDETEYTEAKVKAGEGEVERVASDSWITAKAKAALLSEENLKSLRISVETFKGQVLLSGFVATDTLKNRAEQVVSKIEGVTSVKNGISVRK